MNELRVEFGTLQGIRGTPVTYANFTFMPAVVDLSGNGFSIDFELRDFVGKQPLSHPFSSDQTLLRRCLGTRPIAIYIQLYSGTVGS